MESCLTGLTPLDKRRFFNVSWHFADSRQGTGSVLDTPLTGLTPLNKLSLFHESCVCRDFQKGKVTIMDPYLTGLTLEVGSDKFPSIVIFRGGGYGEKTLHSLV